MEAERIHGFSVRVRGQTSVGCPGSGRDWLSISDRVPHLSWHFLHLWFRGYMSTFGGGSYPNLPSRATTPISYQPLEPVAARMRGSMPHFGVVRNSGSIFGLAFLDGIAKQINQSRPCNAWFCFDILDVNLKPSPLVEAVGSSDSPWLGRNAGSLFVDATPGASQGTRRRHSVHHATIVE